MHLCTVVDSVYAAIMVECPFILHD